MKKKLLLLGIVCLINSYCIGQTNVFKGKVVSPDTGEAVLGATVRIPGTKVDAVTDIDGEFQLNAEGETIIVQVSAISQLLEFKLYSNIFNIIEFGYTTIKSYAPEQYIDEVYVSVNLPFQMDGVSKEELSQSNLGQDLPFLLEHLPSVTTTSDAGAGVGYTGIRVRGSDASRTNVTINGIPLNDAESQGVFWVNMPDFAGSVEGMSVVRGAGTSTNGAGAFGASVHLNTKDHADSAYGNYNTGIGTFNTIKNAIEFGSGKIGNYFSLEGRLSKITSDGYIDRASSDLQSYYLAAAYTTKNTDVEFITFSGKEITYQAWNGVEESLLKTDRTSNVYTYENQVDDYKQDHYQFLTNSRLIDKFQLRTGLHYTKGKGFFEEFKKK